MIRLNRIYPILFATVPVLQIASGNPGAWAPGDVALMTLGAVVVTALVYLVLALIARRWSSAGDSGGQMAALATTLLVLLFYRYVAMVRWLGRFLGALAHPALLLGGLAGSLAIVWWFSRRPQVAERVGAFLSLMSVIVVGWLLLGVVQQRWRDHRLIARSGLVQRLARPIGARPAAAHSGKPRDIYLIVLDEYANNSVLRERLGFDNHRFEDSLRALGFIIPVVHSNYVHTWLSIPSLINTSHLLELQKEMGTHTTDPSLPNYLVQNNRTARFLKSQGYKYVLFPSQWWMASSHSPEADSTFEAWHGWKLGRELSHTEFRRVLRGQTPLKVLQPDYRDDVDHVRRTFAGIAQLPKDPAPTFAFAHVLNPHPPFVFTRRCLPASRREAASNPRARIGRYVEQLNCLNDIVLQVVTTLIRSSPEPPIIILQGDHGTNTLRFSNSPTAAEIPMEKRRERLGAFGAYYLPGGGDREFGDSVTLVNVLGNVLRYYFGANLPREPDDMYLSLEGSPFDFYKVKQLQ